MERLQKVIAASGLCSRRKAEEMMTEGRVTVNGEVVTLLGTKVTQKDEILVDGKPLKHEAPVHYVLYKPEGCVSTTDDEKKRKTVMEFVPDKPRVYPVGRLDYDTSGVLLLTNDGEFTNKMIHPSSKLEKEYEVTVQGFVRKETSRKLCRGVYIDRKKTMPAKIYRVTYNKEKATTKLNLIITEGKYHQVKRMFEAVNHPVTKLKRVRFGCITLEGLQKGQARLLKPHEYKQLHVLTTKKQVKS